jgi:hypothetical protein
MTELMYKGSTAIARQELRDDIGIIDLREFVALSGEPLNVISEGLTRLLPATLQTPGVARPHVCALEVAGKDLLEIHPAINRASGQVINPGPSSVG